MEELEIMREQMAALKSRLDTQKIVNADLMRKVMRGKASWINRFVKFELISVPITFLLFVGICYIYGISQWYSVSFLVLGGIDALLDLKTARISPKIFSEPILEMRRYLIKQKEQRFLQTCVMSAVCLIWVCLLLSAMLSSSASPFKGNDFMEGVQTGGITGAIIGGIAGLIAVVVIYQKMQRTNDAILNDLKELQEE